MAAASNDNLVDRYVALGHRRVAGWLDPNSANIIAGLGRFQVSQGYAGAVGEIGVHHGKLFILMALSAAAQDKCFAIDVFNDQHLNTDQSGRGDKDVFIANLRSFGIDPASVAIVHKSSLDVSPEDIMRVVGPVRLISVDGGHTEECIISDMRLADGCLTGEGVVVIDDVFNGTWPAVVTGYTAYLADRPGTVPFAISPNKVYACRADRAGEYRDWFRSSFSAIYDRSDGFAGFPVDTYGAWPRPSLPRRVAAKLGRAIGR